MTAEQTAFVPLLVFYLLTGVRFTGMMFTAPVFFASASPLPVRFWTAFILTVVAAGVMRADVPLVLFENWTSIALLATREFLIGSLLGFLALLFGVFGNSLFVAQGANAVLAAFSGVLLFLTGRKLDGRPETGALAAFIWMVMPSSAAMAAFPATEPLYIVMPFKAKGMAKLFSTHPPIEERVTRLRQMRPSL